MSEMASIVLSSMVQHSHEKEEKNLIRVHSIEWMDPD